MDMTLSTQTQILAAVFVAGFALVLYSLRAMYRRRAPTGADARRWRWRVGGIVAATAILNVTALVVHEGGIRDRQPASGEQIAALEGCEQDRARATLERDQVLLRGALERIKKRCAQEAKDQAMLEAHQARVRAVAAAQRAALGEAGDQDAGRSER